MLMMTIVLIAVIFALALYLKRDVRFNVKVLGATMSLEAKDRNVPPAETRSKASIDKRTDRR